MRSMRLFMVICFVSIAPMTVFGQWTAVSAQKITTRRVISPTGTVLQDTTTTGNYYRSSSGSVATTTLQTSPDGEVQYKAGRLLDNVGLAVYTIDYQNKIAYRNTQLSHPREFQDDPATYSQDHQHSVIDGLKCVVLPIMENGKQVGSVWKSAKYDLGNL